MAKHNVADSAQYFTAMRTRFARAIVDGDHEGARQVTHELLLTQCTLGAIYVKVMGPALVEVGDRWCRGDIGVGEQKLATEIVVGQMDRLRAVFTKGVARSSDRVLVCCVEGEFHFVGARMLADLCFSEGFSVDFLGPDVPSDALLATINGRHPQVLALSVTMPDGLEKARGLIETTHRVMPSLRVILGGQGVTIGASSVSVGKHCEIGRNAVEGVARIGQLLRSNGPLIVLAEYQRLLARRVRALRTRMGWTQERLAQASKVTRVCIVAVEGAKQNVSMDVLVRLANALGVKPESLLAVEEE